MKTPLDGDNPGCSYGAVIGRGTWQGIIEREYAHGSPGALTAYHSTLRKGGRRTDRSRGQSSTTNLVMTSSNRPP